MKIISWNVNVLGSKTKRKKIKEMLGTANMVLVMIQETKVFSIY